MPLSLPTQIILSLLVVLTKQYCVFQALVVVVILGWLFVPIYIKAGVKRTHISLQGSMKFSNSHNISISIEGSRKLKSLIYITLLKNVGVLSDNRIKRKK